MCTSLADETYPRVALTSRVLSVRSIAPGVSELSVSRASASGGVPVSVPGQFFMLRARPSAVLLGRPISVYLEDTESIRFLVLSKGTGSAELCALRSGDSVDLIGPIGNRFLRPDELAVPAGSVSGSPVPDTRIALIGGGIGVAPVAGFARSLAQAGYGRAPATPEGGFDFYASFRSAPYGLEGLDALAGQIIITTEDGSAGVKGMLPAVFDPGKYDYIYACGPTPMLRYIQTACAEASSADTGPRAFLSLEEHMACGAGACLGCTVRTVKGNRRCCVDGPVFDAAEVIL